MGFEPLEDCRKESGGPFYGLAKWLWKKLERYRLAHPAYGAGSRDALSAIFGEVQAGSYYERFQIRKLEKLLLLFGAGMGLAGILTVIAVLQENGVSELERPEAPESARQYELDVRAGEEQLTGILLEVPARVISEEEAGELLLKAEEELDALVISWGTDAVDGDLSFPDSLQSGAVDVRFESSCYDLLDGAGHVRNALVSEEGELLTLRATLSCGTQQREISYPVRIIPKGQDLASRLEREVARLLLEAEQEEGGIFVLPEEFDGCALSWEFTEPVYGAWIALLTIVGCIVLSVAFERDLQREGEKRREEMLLSYPSFLSRLTLLAGTGMPIRMVFARMAKEASRKGASPVYEEVQRTCREMESGITELRAYENFGKRCRLPQYKKCASLLSQNVRKGTGGLLSALNQEAELAFEERKALARRKGEEAQTKLLLPMIMILVMVMILIMAPACFSFGGI